MRVKDIRRLLKDLDDDDREIVHIIDHKEFGSGTEIDVGDSVRVLFRSKLGIDGIYYTPEEDDVLFRELYKKGRIV